MEFHFAAETSGNVVWGRNKKKRSWNPPTDTWVYLVWDVAAQVSEAMEIVALDRWSRSET